MCFSDVSPVLCFQVGLTSASPWTNTTLRSLRGENCSRSYHSPFYLFLSIIIVIVIIITITTIIIIIVVVVAIIIIIERQGLFELHIHPWLSQVD